MQSPSLLLPAIQTIHKITNARTGYHKQSHEIKSPLNFCWPKSRTSPHFSRLKDLYPDEGNKVKMVHYNQLINNKLA